MPANYDKPISPLLLTDFYKICHKSFYDPKTEKLVSYWTPRKSRIEGITAVVMFMLQFYVKKYLIDYFNVYFFQQPWPEVEQEYMEVIGASLNEDIAAKEIAAFHELHELGYLPIEIRAVPEGTLVPIGCPMIEFRNTDPRFFWLINYLETLGSCSLWYGQTSATIGHAIRGVVDEWYGRTADDDVPRSTAAGDFSMRGMTSPESAPVADAGHLLSFASTATVPSLPWLHNFYNAPYTTARGTPSTEHSVMESYTPACEFEAYRHLIEDVMPNGVLSMVSDTWDLWRVITEYLPKLKPSIMKRNGKIVIRPDSGDPAEILCGIEIERANTDMAHAKEYYIEKAKTKQDGTLREICFRERVEDDIVEVTCRFGPAEDGAGYGLTVDEVELHNRPMLPEEKGAIELMWDTFGGRVNTKGYKVLDPHVGLIYGDAITLSSAPEIYRRAAEKGFASNNVTLGIGSYTYQYVTRDTFGFALKVTNGVLDGREVPMFKDPVTDRGSHGASKKSQKGMCIVVRDAAGTITYTDGHTEQEAMDAPENLLQPVFRDGVLLRDEDFDTIRRRLNPDF